MIWTDEGISKTVDQCLAASITRYAVFPASDLTLAFRVVHALRSKGYTITMIGDFYGTIAAVVDTESLILDRHVN